LAATPPVLALGLFAPVELAVLVTVGGVVVVCAHAPPTLRARTAQVANRTFLISSFLFLSRPCGGLHDLPARAGAEPLTAQAAALKFLAEFACRPLKTSNRHANKMPADFLVKT
jgi:hypothetical protein